jgi:acyl carrier protein
MNREEIAQGVCECVALVVDTDPSSVREGDRMIEDLGADSLDLLDLVFHLEQKFRIKISPRDIERRAQRELGEIPLEVDGVYTPEAVVQLRKALPEVPVEEFSEGLRTVDLPRRFRVATFVRLVMRLMEEQHV